jgi:hypothetical protein
MALTREDYVVQSVQNYLKLRLEERGYTEGDHYTLIDAFTGGEIESPLKKSHVASGFNFDDGGRQAELGSSLVTRVYTIEFFVFGVTATWGRNLAQAIKFALERDGIIPLVDIAQPHPHPATGEVLTLESVSAERQVIQDPADWQRYVWTVHLKVEDIYDARMA